MRGGKKFGPYFYENYRVDGVTKTRYLGTSLPEEKKNSKNTVGKVLRDNFKKENFFSRRKLFCLIGIAFFILIVSSLYFFSGVTGKAVLDISDFYSAGEVIGGNLSLILKQGELIPSGTEIVVTMNSQEKVILLSDVLSDAENGTYFVEGKNIEGSGEGFGTVAERISYPAITFSFRFIEENNSEIQPVENNTIPIVENITEVQPAENISQPADDLENSTEILPEQPAEDNSISENPITSGENPAQETPQEQSQQNPLQETQQPETSASENSQTENPATSSETSSEQISAPQSEETSSSITGGVISSDTIEASVSADSPYDYSLQEGKTAEIIPGSVKVNGESINDSAISVKIENGKAVFSTDYKITESGFGEDYLTDEVTMYGIGLEQFGIRAEQGMLNIKFVYNNETLVEAEALINVEENNTLDENKKLKLIHNIPDVTIRRGESYILDLNDYFENAEYYSYANVSNVSITISADEAMIIPDEDFSGLRGARIIAHAGNEIVESNLFKIRVSSNVSIAEYSEIKINEKAYFKKNIKLEKSSNLTLVIPIEAENVSVTDISNGETIGDKSSAKMESAGPDITGFASLKINDKKDKNDDKKNKDKDKDKKNKSEEVEEVIISQENISESAENISVNLPTENITLGENVSIEANISAIPENNSTPTGNISDSQTNSSDNNGILEENGEVVVQDNLIKDYSKEIKINNTAEVQLEYNLPAPVSTETNLSAYSKRIEISSDYHFENILAYTNIFEIAKNSYEIKLYWFAEENYTETSINATTNETIEINETRIVKENWNFTSYDLDENGFIDYMEWNVPHLSNQTFEIIIEISKAELLDENRTFVSDIYDYVKAQDNNWTTANNSQYVRVTFEKNLTSANDITVYAKQVNKSVVIDGQEVPYDVYLKKKRIDEIRGQIG